MDDGSYANQLDFELLGVAAEKLVTTLSRRPGKVGANKPAVSRQGDAGKQDQPLPFVLAQRCALASLYGRGEEPRATKAEFKGPRRPTSWPGKPKVTARAKPASHPARR